MEGSFKEQDWKAMRKMHDELLHALCSQINAKAVEIVSQEGKNPHERYLELYCHIKDSDGIIADCFNDWRRSNIVEKIMYMRRYEILKDSHCENFTDSAREWLSMIEEAGCSRSI